MSTVPPVGVGTPDTGADTPSQSSKPQRVLACVLCQKRKLKCNRQNPCSNCLKSRAQCVPATLAQRPRKRRFPEGALLDRLRKYEDLLRQNNIEFEPLHNDAAKESVFAESGNESNDKHIESARQDSSAPSTTTYVDKVSEAKNIWHAMSQGFRDPDNDSDSSYDDVRETIVKDAWDHSTDNDEYLLFGSSKKSVDLSLLHPSPIQVFRLWQIYLDNVNPLLKVTHTPSLQGRIIEAASNVPNINSTLEALMFSIYCMAITSLCAEDCQSMLGSSKADLLMKYQLACQQALSKSGFLRTHDYDCLTALYLYLISVRPSTVPQSLSSMLGVAIRIAQRMGIHSESALAKCTVVEAEMRRRLWWSLVLFDTRIGQMASSRATMLDPLWDCKIPLNVNDSDLRLEMRKLPGTQGQCTDALFAVVRSELGDFLRHTAFHLDFTNPALKSMTKGLHGSPASEGTELMKLEEMIENQYLKSCDQENPIHFMTVWTTRAQLAKFCLLEQFSRRTGFSISRTARHDVATSYALRMLECDTKILTSSLTKGFLWLNESYFPFPAYVQIIQDLKTRPQGEEAPRAWEIMSDNYEARFGTQASDSSPFFQMFTRVVLQAWKACAGAYEQSKEFLIEPRIVSSMNRSLAQKARHRPEPDTSQADLAMDIDFDEILRQMPTNVPGQSLPYDMATQGYPVMQPGTYHDIPGGAQSELSWDYLDWTALGGQPGSGGY